MKRTIATTTTLLAILLIGSWTGLIAAPATHTQFTGTVGLLNACEGLNEFVVVAGPQDNLYVASDDGSHFVIHLVLHATGTGNKGNAYNVLFEANGQFDAPTGTDGPGVTFFDVPIHAEVITKGGAPNFDWDLGIRVFVFNGEIVGSFLIGPETRACHG
jgi:hypothetical protein